MKRVIAVLSISALFLTGCGNGGGSVTNLNSAGFADVIKDESVILVDVRTPLEFASGHIQGATNIDWESGHFESDIKALDMTKKYAVYCRSGNRSNQAVSLMSADGFRTVYNLKRGILDWTLNGLPTVTQ